VNPAFRRVILTGCSEEDRRRARRIVMDSCLARLDAPGSPEEILTQAKAIGNWREFANLIARPDLAEALMRQAPEALAAAWSELSAHGSAVPERVYDAWAGVEPPSRVALAAEFLVARGALLAAERCAKDAAGRAAQTDIATRVPAQLVLARVAETGGRLNEAETYTSGVAEVASIAGDGAMRALAAANILRLIFLRDGASAAASRTAAVRSLAAPCIGDGHAG
jgi:ATP/maltotriose-dependent transcriptional regulator MalT